LFPLHTSVNAKYQFEIKRKPAHGGDALFDTFADLEKAFAENLIHPGDLKKAATISLDALLAPIRRRFEDPALVSLTARAYPNQPSSASSAKQPAHNPKQKPAQNAPTEPAQIAQSDLSRVDLRVGFIKSAVKHPNADSLYVEEIDVGDGEGRTRTVVSGLAKFIPLEQMVERRVVVVCNLKPTPMRGVISSAMVLAASNADRTQVELVEPPAGAIPGERIHFNEDHVGKPDEQLNPKKKVWEKVQEHLKTTDNCIAAFNGIPFLTSAGACKVQSLKGASIS